MAADDYAIVVGIGAYPELGSLDGPCNDAQAFYDWLVNPAGGAVDRAKASLLLTTKFHPPGPSSVNDAHPVEDEVNSLFAPYVDAGAMQGHVGGRLYIYMAGHGFSDMADMNSAALYAANARNMFAPHVAGTAYAEWFRRNAVFDEIVLIMDCCRVLNPIHAIRPPPLPNTFPGRSAQAAVVRTFYAFGTSWGSVARERSVAGTVRGIFTLTLLEALDKARPNRQGRVTGAEIKDYIHNAIDRIADGHQVTPPDIRNPDPQITFQKRNAAPALAVNVRLDPYVGGEIVVVHSSAQQEVGRAAATQSLVEFNLEPGLYKSVVEGTPRKQLFEVVQDNVEITL